jgi:hypothetical protein
MLLFRLDYLFIWLKLVRIVCLIIYLCLYCLMIKGCFVPANKIRLGLMDKLFVKIHTGLCRKILTLKKNLFT